jgi:hypothetical protein
MIRRVLLVLALILPIVPTAATAQSIPILFDTDIGTDIDDAYAPALILRSPELELLGVTTVSGAAVARARLAAKLLAIEGGARARLRRHVDHDPVHEAGRLGGRVHVAGAAHRRRRRLHAPLHLVVETDGLTWEIRNRPANAITGRLAR